MDLLRRLPDEEEAAGDENQIPPREGITKGMKPQSIDDVEIVASRTTGMMTPPVPSRRTFTRARPQLVRQDRDEDQVLGQGPPNQALQLHTSLPQYAGQYPRSISTNLTCPDACTSAHAMADLLVDAMVDVGVRLDMPKVVRNALSAVQGAADQGARPLRRRQRTLSATSRRRVPAGGFGAAS